MPIFSKAVSQALQTDGERELGGRHEKTADEEKIGQERPMIDLGSP